MYKSIAVIVVLLLSVVACGKIPGWRIEMAVKKCKEHGGVNYLTKTGSTTTSWVICTDGTQFPINLIKANK